MQMNVFPSTAVVQIWIVCGDVQLVVQMFQLLRFNHSRRRKLEISFHVWIWGTVRFLSVFPAVKRAKADLDTSWTHWLHGPWGSVSHFKGACEKFQDSSIKIVMIYGLN